MRDEPDVGKRCQTARSSETPKRCWFMQTAGRWSWKSKAAKKCVTTYLPNEVALKMEGAEASDRTPTVTLHVRVTSRRAGWRSRRLDVSPTETSSRADLGGSSNDSKDSLGRLKWGKFPWEPRRSMGESVLRARQTLGKLERESGSHS
jgi:hypothetical protein